MQQAILDMCCGSRMFWFDKQDERAVFSDIRAEQHELCDGRQLVISPTLLLISAPFPLPITPSLSSCSIRRTSSVWAIRRGWGKVRAAQQRNMAR
jgi:hypothetical protein